LPPPAAAGRGAPRARGGEDGERETYSSLRARWAAAAASEDFSAAALPGSADRAKELVPACRITTGARAAEEKERRAKEAAAAAAEEAKGRARAQRASSSSEA
jgi:hypothetical protein